MTREEAIKELELIVKVTMWNDRREAVEMAIEALSKPSDGDLISRQDAINIANSDGAYGYISAEELAKLPSVQPEDKCGECDAWNQYKNYPRQRWIPCSERLPSEYEKCLCYQEDGNFYTYWLEDSDWARKEVESNGIIAWMSLPEPYKGGDNK